MIRNKGETPAASASGGRAPNKPCLSRLVLASLQELPIQQQQEQQSPPTTTVSAFSAIIIILFIFGTTFSNRIRNQVPLMVLPGV
jgi:hypothetical protein